MALMDQVYQGSDGQLPAVGGQAVVGTTAVQMVIPGPINVNTSFTLFSTGTVAGVWLIEASNDFTRSETGLGTNFNAGHWTDITAAFRTPNATTGTAIVNPSGAGLATYVEYMGNPGCGLGAKSLRVTFTPSAGAGNFGIAANSNRT
jgi:hypothetical protein